MWSPNASLISLRAWRTSATPIPRSSVHGQTGCNAAATFTRAGWFESSLIQPLHLFRAKPSGSLDRLHLISARSADQPVDRRHGQQHERALGDETGDDGDRQ